MEKQLLNPKEIHDLEPNIKPIYDGGVFYSYAKHTNNPRRLLLSYLIYFYKRRESFINIKLKDINFDEEKPVLRTESQRFVFDKIVIACGALSKKFTNDLFENIPLDTERGYHIHFKDCENLISRPVVYSNRGFGMTPMEQGLELLVLLNLEV